MASYCQGEIDQAILLAEQAANAIPQSAEAWWQVGRHLWESRNHSRAYESFKRSLQLDFRYAKRFEQDPVFQSRKNDYDNMIKRLKNEFSGQQVGLVELQKAETLVKKCSDGVDPVDAGNLIAPLSISQLANDVREIRRAHDRQSVGDLAFLATRGKAALKLIFNRLGSLIRACEEIYTSKLNERRSSRNKRKMEGIKKGIGAGLAAFIAVLFILIMIEVNEITALSVGFLFSIPVGFFAYMSESESIRKISKEANELARRLAILKT